MSSSLHQCRLEKVAELRDEIVIAGDKAQELRRLPDDMVVRLVDEGFFRFTLPQELGGEDASSMETIEVLEQIAAIDASVSWNVMLGSEINAMAAGGMDPTLAKQIYVDNPRVIMCGSGGLGPVQPRAERQADGGVRVWSQANFVSGCHNADFCFMAAPLMRGNKPELNEAGQPIFRMWFLPRQEWEILDTWDVAGLRGSGSDDVRADGAYIPAELADVELWTLPAQYENPVYRIPVPLRLAYNKVAVALGVARGAIETFVEIAQSKIPHLSSKSLMHRPIAQYRVGEAEAIYSSARAYVMASMAEVEAELRAGEPVPTGPATQKARLACVHGANECMRVVDMLHNTAGTTGMRMHSPLERKLRDAHGCASHRWVSHPLYQDLGAIRLGHEPEEEFAGSGRSRSTGPGLK